MAFQVFRFIVWFIIFPAPESDSNPLKSKRTDDGIVWLDVGDLLLVVGLSPEEISDRLSGPFDEWFA